MKAIRVRRIRMSWYRLRATGTLELEGSGFPGIPKTVQEVNMPLLQETLAGKLDLLELAVNQCMEVRQKGCREQCCRFPNQSCRTAVIQRLVTIFPVGSI